MNDELQRQLAELVKQLVAVANDAGGWARTQIPPLVQEKILYGRIQHSVLVVVCAVVAWRAAIYTQTFYRQACAHREAEDGRYSSSIWPDRPGGLASILCASICVGSVIFAVVHLNYAVMAWLTPRLFIVEWLISMTTKG